MNIYILIILMTLVTFLPRMLPFRFIDSSRLPAKLRQFLSCIPYAALGALIIPGGFYSINGDIFLSGLGLFAAACFAFLKINVVISMGLTILIIYPFYS